MKTVNIQAAKTHLARLVEQACAGEEIVIARDHVPLVRLVPVATAPVERRFGAYRDLGPLPESFFEPLPDDELDAWEGGGR
jgi:antitoxin (DNA-binding transcriptional repressor) of toxin-antitoxin stability system